MNHTKIPVTGGTATGQSGEFSYGIIRSDRRSVSLEVTRDGGFRVRAPHQMPTAEIEQFVSAHRLWMVRQRARMIAFTAVPEPDAAEIERLRAEAHRVLPPLIARYAAVMGVTPTGMTVTAAKTRHGSCSPKNRLCFSLYLMRYPREAVEYVVVHELAHIIHKNHGAAFYRTVAAVLPDYRERIALLRKPPSQGVNTEDQVTTKSSSPGK